MTKPQWVWCPYEQAPSTVRDGHCTSCGATDHLGMEEAQRQEREELG